MLQAVRSVDRNRPALRTLACGASASSDWAYLAPRRFALFVISAIERGTRWAVLSANVSDTRRRVAKQVGDFLEALRAAGAFASVPADQAFLVICDERINDCDDEHDDPGTMNGTTDGTINILLQLAGIHAGEYQSFMITHAIRGSVVRPVVINRLEASFLISRELAQEITIKVQHEAGVVRVMAG